MQRHQSLPSDRSKKLRYHNIEALGNHYFLSLQINFHIVRILKINRNLAPGSLNPQKSIHDIGIELPPLPLLMMSTAFSWEVGSL
jgi:hypothetical protein